MISSPSGSPAAVNPPHTTIDGTAATFATVVSSGREKPSSGRCSVSSGAVPAVGAEIVWRRVPGARYSVTVVDTTGATQWTAETTDTSAAVPDSVRLAPGGRYYLYVDALRSDGWSLRSDRREFRTAR